MVYAIVVAGGKGTRMGSRTPKQFMDIDGHPMLYYSLKALEESRCDSIVIVTGQSMNEEGMLALETARKIVLDGEFTKVKRIVVGGAERYDSCYSGIVSVPATLDDIVLIHDAARPKVTAELINCMIDAARTYDAAVPVVKIKDTIVRATANEDGGYEVIDRNALRAVQTPQAFRYGLLRNAYDALQAEQDKSWVTDDAMVVSRMLHMNIKQVEGDENNIKVTTPADVTRIRYRGYRG